MPKLANANKRTNVIAALRRAGFTDEAGGRHTLILNADGDLVSTVPNHREINPTTLRAILRQCGLSEREYLKLY